MGGVRDRIRSRLGFKRKQISQVTILTPTITPTTQTRHTIRHVIRHRRSYELQQPIDLLQVVALRGNHQRGFAILVRRARIGAALQQPIDLLQVAVPAATISAVSPSVSAALGSAPRYSSRSISCR